LFCETRIRDRQMPSKKVQNFSLTPLAQTHSLGTHTEQIHIQMRTKAILLAAAFAAAGVATSMAQVYSVNAVGYVNKTLTPGFTLVSNPLIAADNTIQALFNNFQGGVRDGTTVYKFVGGGFQTAGFDEFGGWGGAGATVTLMPGEGAFVFIPNPQAGEAANKVLTFVGEVPQNNTTTPLPRGFSMKSSVVPQAVAPDNVKNTDGSSAAIPAVDGDTIYRWNPAAKGYTSYLYTQFDPQTPGEWASGNTTGLPTFDVGEAFYYFRLGAATTWNRTFSVNNPQ
jgi:hypothetical protein